MSPGCLFSSPPSTTDGGKSVESCRICNSTWQPEQTWWETLGTGTPGRASAGWGHGKSGRTDREDERTAGRTPGRGQSRRIILFHLKGVSSTRSGPGRRELKPPGFVSINCLEAGWFPTLARRARAGAGLGDARRRGGTGCSGGSFSWSHSGLGAGPGAAGEALRRLGIFPGAAGGSPVKARDILWPCGSSGLVQVRASHRGEVWHGQSSAGWPGPTRAQGLSRRGGICPLSVKLNLGLVGTQQKQLVCRAGFSFPAAAHSAGAQSHESHPSSFTKFFLLFPPAQPPRSSSFL